MPPRQQSSSSLHSTSSSATSSTCPETQHVPRYLRSALRYIHCLQKERGSSSLHAFKQKREELSPQPSFEQERKRTNISHSALINARQRTDAAFRLYQDCCNVSNVNLEVSSSWEAVLQNLRILVDAKEYDNKREEVVEGESKLTEEVAQTQAAGTESPHQILSSYHRLIEQVISISIVEVVTQEESFFLEQHQASQHRLHEIKEESHDTERKEESSQYVPDRASAQSFHVLALLMSFVKLKESLGLERAILSSLMALGTGSESAVSSSPSSLLSSFSSDVRLKLFSDLVVEEANQRSIVRELKSQTKLSIATYPSTSLLSDEDRVATSPIGQFQGLMTLVEQFVQPSPSMEQLQLKIHTEFDVEALQSAMPVQKFWEMITLYIDQLHALELLFIEELEMMWMNSTGIVTRRRSIDAVTEGPPDTNTGLINGLPVIPPKACGSTPSLKIFPSVKPPSSSREWEIDLYDIEFRKRIGSGVGGTTYLAKWSGGDVAVKVAAFTGIGLEGWHAEVTNLQRLHHPNVIRLLGIFNNTSPQTYGLVLEYCNAGDLSGEFVGVLQV